MYNPFAIIDAAALEEVFGDPFCNEPEDILPDYPIDEDNMAHLLPLDRWEDRKIPLKMQDHRGITKRKRTAFGGAPGTFG